MSLTVKVLLGLVGGLVAGIGVAASGIPAPGDRRRTGSNHSAASGSTPSA